MNDTYYQPQARRTSDAAAESIPSPDGHSNLINTDYTIGQDNITSGFWG
ncbi:hypothetical protein MBH78_23435 [Oceanimonas sp. NS1]|nr:hypothetical protein [Oceanimonas sp. NS1]